jgi:hypothetical protein
MRRVGGSLALVACALLAGCGAPERLSEREGTALLDAREVIDSTIDTEETLRTSPEEARRIRRQVREIVSRGAFETAPLDEFGLAALGELREIVPGLAETDSEGVVESLDRTATRAFLRYATTDAERALVKPANDEVFAIEEVVRKAEPGPDTDVPPRRGEQGDLTVDEFLRGTERDLEPIWPQLAERLARLRGDL